MGRISKKIAFFWIFCPKLFFFLIFFRKGGGSIQNFLNRKILGIQIDGGGGSLVREMLKKNQFVFIAPLITKGKNKTPPTHPHPSTTDLKISLLEPFPRSRKTYSRSICRLEYIWNILLIGRFLPAGACQVPSPPFLDLMAPLHLGTAPKNQQKEMYKHK